LLLCHRFNLPFSASQADEEIMRQAKAKVDQLLADIHKMSQEAADQGLIDKEKYVIPPHLHDLQEADLPETQRGLVMTEIAQFRERAAKREREKLRDVQAAVPTILNMPSGPKQREWGKPGGAAQSSPTAGRGPSYGKTPGFVRAGDDRGTPAADDRESSVSRSVKTDEELEAERKEARRRDEENSFKDVRSSQLAVFIAHNFGF
jgi:RNA-binding protein 25